ncbi:gamma-tubulin SCDLUD_000259 [Saccharomycodes ludwigii]|uniref:gamma-tubulin n=1 Tax=Saccharomycodes ludwigii TaxID=36035 RepID=UPI001E8BF613|nr:hypothetical protein SCDLUD_000259 [Saccharomycodes ludwigii]KAH3902676.1 hypothetical protein SCDLUD_000259 [Saccharomycodes ludwigii]
MTGEIVTLQVGQCGNQLGKQFWSQLIKEHGMNKDGTSALNNDDKNFIRIDEPNIFFRQIESNRYTPRSILLDMEPSSVNDVRNTLPGLFDDKNVWLSKDSMGAGNVWANGYDHGLNYQDDIINIIDKELDSADNFEGFQLLHSVAGGTGSGLGSELLETLSDRYHKKLITTYSVFPSTESDVVVQPYNTVLTLRRLVENSDAAIVFDNNALIELSTRIFRNPNTSFSEANQLISTVMSSLTNSIRFPGYMYNSMSNIFTTMVPSPNLHFLVPSYTPFTTDFIPEAKNFKRKTAYDVILDLFDQNNSMCCRSNVELATPSYIAIWDCLQGTIDQTDCMRAILKAQKRIKFVPWSTPAINLNIGKKSPYNTTPNSSHASGLMIANSTSIKTVLENSCRNFDVLFRRNAFITKFENGRLFQNSFEEFRASREVVQNVIEEYVSVEHETYIDDILLEDEEMIMVGDHEIPNET